ncbi:hypothetical protein GCM10010156_03100 [Planobispora rosea]|uniref:Uncharacterized protein n=1 Tax=Planobispora rosea TaxID=35762 RepID=A0A8J3RUR2_PLARO|nr:hypothetical protein [Planobispora rosea]GGS47720.1 hypothetical protein GCM10010156_03100 [Planobispora rosea]GIH82177.1 hypothetical protein Pro02_05850 [Planobispora rosea]
MTDAPDEYGELLRRVLSAEADSVVPSPDGLEIIRARIERRGLRGLLWWRAGASVLGAILVAAAIVMIVPGLREQVQEFAQPAGRSGPVETTAPPQSGSTSRPAPNTNPAVPPPVEPSASPSADSTAVTPAPPSSSPQPTPATPTPTATPCPTVTVEPTTVEPSEPLDECEESATPTPTPSEASTPPEAPCPVEECPPPDEPLPTPTDMPTPAPADS